MLWRGAPFSSFVAVMLAVVAAFSWISTAAAQAPDRRVVLLIGNNAYKGANALRNPVNDATALAESFKRMGFDRVMLHTNLGQAAMLTVLREFSAEASKADIAVVFFAGHGVEISAENYLIPVDAQMTEVHTVEIEAIQLRGIRKAISRAKKLRLIILDACRDNPFRNRLFPGASPSFRRSVPMSPGQTHVDTGDNEMIAFAAKEGQQAEDGNGTNSPFTTGLLKYIETPGEDVQRVFGRVRDEVSRLTNRTQTPHTYGSLGGDPIFLRPPVEQAKAIDPGRPQAPDRRRPDEPDRGPKTPVPSTDPKVREDYERYETDPKAYDKRRRDEEAERRRKEREAQEAAERRRKEREAQEAADRLRKEREAQAAAEAAQLEHAAAVRLEELPLQPGQRDGRIIAGAASADGRLLSIASSGTLHMWSLSPRQRIAATEPTRGFEAPVRVTAMAIGPQGAVVARANGSLATWDYPGIPKVEFAQRTIHALAWDGQQFVAAAVSRSLNPRTA